MKRILLFILSISTSSIFAQLYTPNGGVLSSNTNTTGNVGIGTENPNKKLEIYNIASMGHLRLSANDDPGADLSRIDVDFHINPHNQTIARIASKYLDSGNGGSGGLRFLTRSKGVLSDALYISDEGNAALKGRFEAKEVKVTLTPTADFVFNENYDLPRLEDIERHIKEKKHLPEIASARVMEKEGVNVGEFQIKLLQKIEELTLYSIQQNKEIKKLQEENKALQSQSKKIEKLEQQIQKLLSAPCYAKSPDFELID